MTQKPCNCYKTSREFNNIYFVNARGYAFM